MLVLKKTELEFTDFSKIYLEKQGSQQSCLVFICAVYECVPQSCVSA